MIIPHSKNLGNIALHMTVLSFWHSVQCKACPIDNWRSGKKLTQY